MTRDKIIKRIQAEAQYDCRALWKIISYAACDTGKDENYDEDDPTIPHPNSIMDAAIIKTKTLSLVRDLLNTQCIVAGNLANEGQDIDPWPEDVEAVVSRIDREWTALGKEPDMKNDLVWFGACKPKDWPHGSK